MSARRVIVMGPSGSGKTAVGAALAVDLAVEFVDADDLHPAANVAKMAAGDPLDDADRIPWLDIVGRTLADLPGGGVIACSALKRRYRDRLRAAAPPPRFVYLHGTPALLGARLAARRGHYMPASLLPSQLQTLEPPDADEGALAFDIAESPAAIVQRVVRSLEPT